MIDYDKVLNEISAESEKSLIIAPIDLNAEVLKSKLGIEKVGDIVRRANSMLVETDSEAREALSTALEARKIGKEISKLRKNITAPATTFQKRSIAIERQFTDQLETVESDLFEKIEVYQEQRKASLKSSGIIDESFDRLKVELGSSSIKSYFEFTIENIDEVPREYLKLDTTKLNENIKKGVRAVSGVKIIEVKKRQFRLNNSRKKQDVLV